jgi:polyisoprenoid-binding protein YceI
LIVTNSPAIASGYPEAGTYEVVKSESEIRVLVYRGGLFGIFGHNHVISTSDIDGRIVISEDQTGSSVELKIPVESFEVDDQALRVEEGDDFKSAVSDKDKRGTKENMLGAELLNASKFSSITIESNSWSGELPDIVVQATFTVRDQSNAVEFPASVSVSEERVVVTGSIDMTHGRLGLKPFTAVFGGLRVHDEMEIKFRISASRITN